MGGATQVSVNPVLESSLDQEPKLRAIKELSESAALTSIPPEYAYSTTANGSSVSEPDDDPIPTIDFSLLTSGDPDKRSRVIQELGKACEEWGFFILVNHGLEERLVDAVMDACDEFFNLSEAEKKEFEGKHVLDPIQFGTSMSAAKAQRVFLWRDFLKVIVHPHFHFPNKPTGFSELAREYCKHSQKVARELLKGISESLGLEDCYIEKAMNLDSGYQSFVANLYPFCPQPELAMGLPPHSDPGLINFLIQKVEGLEVQYNGKWVNVNAPPNSFLVNIADHLQILTNGRYKSVIHRAELNKTAARISIVFVNGPSLDTVVSPAPELSGSDGHPPAYIPMKYKDYMVMQQNTKLGKSALDQVRLQIV
ncbi:hypothetical protein U1Q18_035302 [Sarracenia purpurea var. burkii]